MDQESAATDRSSSDAISPGGPPPAAAAGGRPRPGPEHPRREHLRVLRRPPYPRHARRPLAGDGRSADHSRPRKDRVKGNGAAGNLGAEGSSVRRKHGGGVQGIIPSSFWFACEDLHSALIMALATFQ